MPSVHDLPVRTDIDKATPFCHSRRPGAGIRGCVRCNNQRGHVRKYGVGLCRRCFHAKAADIGFKSLD